MVEMSKYEAVRKFFERADKFAPKGGQKCTLAELKSLALDDVKELASLAVVELGAKLKS